MRFINDKAVESEVGMAFEQAQQAFLGQNGQKGKLIVVHLRGDDDLGKACAFCVIFDPALGLGQQGFGGDDDSYLLSLKIAYELADFP